MSAVGKWMSPASRIRGHVAHVLLHVRPQGVIFVLNVADTWYFWTASSFLEQSQLKARAVSSAAAGAPKKAKMHLPRAYQTSHVHQILIRPIGPRDPKVLKKSRCYTN